MTMEEVAEILRESYYTSLLMNVSALLAVILAFFNRKKFPELNFMWIYPFASISQIIFFLTVVSFDWAESFENKIICVSINIFILIETAIIYHFFVKIIVIQELKSIIKIIRVLFYAYLLYVWTFTGALFYESEKIFLAESLCVLFPCFFYFIQLFKMPPTVNLSNEPFFWITMGLLFYFSCTIPLFFIDSVLKFGSFYYNMYSINFVAHAIVFLFIARAFLCKSAAKLAANNLKNG